MKQYPIRIRKDGVIEWLSPPPGFYIPVLKQTRTRFSEILPANPFLYVAFRVIRFIFGEGTWMVPAWTRTWPCLWQCKILKGSKRGTVRVGRSRKELIHWEHDQWAMSLMNQ